MNKDADLNSSNTGWLSKILGEYNCSAGEKNSVVSLPTLALCHNIILIIRIIFRFLSMQTVILSFA
jgi:hypothetical protein